MHVTKAPPQKKGVKGIAVNATSAADALALMTVVRSGLYIGGIRW